MLIREFEVDVGTARFVDLTGEVRAFAREAGGDGHSNSARPNDRHVEPGGQQDPTAEVVAVGVDEDSLVHEGVPQRRSPKSPRPGTM